MIEEYEKTFCDSNLRCRAAIELTNGNGWDSFPVNTRFDYRVVEDAFRHSLGMEPPEGHKTIRFNYSGHSMDLTVALSLLYGDCGKNILVLGKLHRDGKITYAPDVLYAMEHAKENGYDAVVIPPGWVAREDVKCIEGKTLRIVKKKLDEFLKG